MRRERTDSVDGGEGNEEDIVVAEE